MLESVWYGIAAALVFFGLVSVIYIIISKIFRTDFDGKIVVILSPDDDRCDIGSILYAAHMRLAIWGIKRNDNIILIDNGLNEKQLDLCRRIMSECGGMKMCKAAELSDVFMRKGI